MGKRDNYNCIKIACYKKSRNLPKIDGVDKKYITKIVNIVSKYLKSDKQFEVTVIFVNDKFIQKYNRDYRGKNSPTNVLSFPSSMPMYLGDIIISIQTIEFEAKEQNKTCFNHFTHILIHSILHLFGMDHIEKKDREKMEKIEIEILKSLNISDPYLI